MRVTDTQDTPALDYLSLSEAKAYLRVDHSDEDALIEDLIQVASDYVATASNTSWKGRTAYGYLEDWVNADFPVGPVNSVTSVEYKASGDTYTTLSTSNYFVRLLPHPARIAFQNYPSLEPDAYDRIRISFTYGYSGEDVSPHPTPYQYKQAMRMLVSHWYDFRGVVVDTMRVQHIPTNVESLISTFRQL